MTEFHEIKHAGFHADVVCSQALRCRSQEAWMEADIIERLHLLAEREAALSRVHRRVSDET